MKLRQRLKALVDITRQINSNGGRWVLKHITLIRWSIVVLFFLIAVWGLYIDFEFGENAWILTNSRFGKFLATSLRNVGPELAGIVIGIVTIDYLNEKRQAQQLKAQLIRQMASPHNEVAGPAVRQLAHYG